MAQDQDPVAGHTFGVLNDTDPAATWDPVAGAMMGYLIGARVRVPVQKFVVELTAHAERVVTFDAW